MKKIISLLLSVIILSNVFITLPLSANAAENSATGDDQSVGLSTDDINVSSSNSLGSMLAEEYEENAENIENTGSNIYAVEVEGNTARVDVRALVDAQLIVSIFDEEGKTMYGSGMADVTPEDSVVELQLEIDTMPQYFYIKAFLLDKSTNKPLCKQFENNYYTEDMQEFFAKTTDDFDEEKVLNLDGSDEDNFLVYNDDTIIIENDDQNTNVVTKADDKSKEYVIENIDDSISTLKSGNIFSYDYGDGNLLIIKIHSITITGSTAVIKGEEIELQEAFDYIKIDTLSYANDARYDGNNIGDGVEYLGTSKDESDSLGAEENGSDSIGVAIADWDVEQSRELKFKFGEEKSVEDYYNSETTEHNQLKKQMYGEFGVKLALNYKFYYDEYLFGRDVEMSLTVKYEFSASLKAKISESKATSIGLGGLFFEPVPGVTISITPSIVVSGKLKASFSLTYSGQIGFKYKNGQSEDLGKSPSCDFKIDFEGELFIGLSLEPKISVLGDVAKAEAEGIAGLRIKGKTHHSTSFEPEPSEKHLCTACIEGDISLVLELNVELSLFNNADLTWKWNLVKAEWKLSDFYWSIDHAEFGFSTCPYRQYKCTVMLVTPKKEPIEGATVNDVNTDSSGKAMMYLQKGQNKLEIKKSGKTVNRMLYVNGTENKTCIIDFDKPENALSGGNCKVVQHHSKVIDSGQCGENVYYTLYDNGLLDITGSGDMYGWSAYIRHAPWDSYRDIIKRVNISNSVTSIGEDAFYNYTKLESITIPDSVTCIEDGAFDHCSSLTSITIPDSVIGIGEYAFYCCTGLKSVTIGNGVTSIGERAFSGCTSLTSISVDKDNPFYDSRNNCNAIIKTDTNTLIFGCKNTIIPNSVTSIGEDAFFSCSSLESITIPDSIIGIGGYAFEFCTGLKSITIPDSVTCIEYGAFNNCSSLTSVTIGNGVTSIGGNAFSCCTGLTSVTIGNGVTIIGERAFSGCTKLESITIPDSVTCIEWGAFSGCTGLKSVTIGNGVTIIGGHAFYKCDNLKDVYYGGSKDEWNKINWDLTNPTIHYNSTGSDSLGCAQPEEERTPKNAANPDIQQKSESVSLGANDETSGENQSSYSRSHLVPDTEAVLLIVKGTEDTAVLNAQSLLYIAQGTVDSNGDISFDVQQDFGNENWVAFIFGECDHSSGKWMISKEATQDENGLKVLVCDHCGAVLDSQPINSLSGNILYGDVNGDNSVDILDATIIQKYAAGKAELTPEQIAAADVNNDNNVDVLDVAEIQKFAAGKITEFKKKS